MSSWATPYIEQLKEGKTVQFRPRGHSMSPQIKDKQLVTVRPVVKGEALSVGTVVLCTVGGRQYLHKIVGVKMDGGFMIGNNKGRQNGCTRQIHGVLVSVEP